MRKPEHAKERKEDGEKAAKRGRANNKGAERAKPRKRESGKARKGGREEEKNMEIKIEKT